MENKPGKTDSAKLKEFTLDSTHVYNGPLLQVYVDDVQLPDGSRATRDWIKHPGASAIVPVFEDGTVMLLKQFRYPAREIFIEVPAGKLDEGESPDNAARRELTEESGLTCTNLQKTGVFYPAIGYADEIIHVFTAWGLTMKEQDVDDDEFVIPTRIRFADALRMIGSGEIIDGKTISALIQTQMWWEKNAPFPVDFS
jgi:ADP-ribose pyrophosphatase